MELSFKYDLEKDAENFIKSFSSVNSKKPTKLQELYTKEIGDLDPVKVPVFLETQKIDISAKLKEIETGWKTIEKRALEKMESLFAISLPINITVYLSKNSRCTYNIKENYFFVYVTSKSPNAIIIHELFHFYTWHAFHDELVRQGITDQKYNDIKESLTEIMNIDFKDLLDGYKDNGYPQHAAMRAQISVLRSENKSIKEIVQILNLT